MGALTAFAALLFPLAAVHLTIAWRDWPPQGAEFDRQTIRALYNVLAWGVFVIGLIYAITLYGLVFPILASLAIWGALWAVRRNVSLTKFYNLTLPLTMVGMVFVVMLFQGVFGDSDFGLFSVFPVDR
ncbi:MAG: hypothetical protein AAFU55_12635 [Pseudomonadota bacterium]